MRKYFSLAALVLIISILFSACDIPLPGNDNHNQEKTSLAGGLEQNTSTPPASSSVTDAANPNVVLASDGKVLFTVVRPFNATSTEFEQFTLLRRSLGEIFDGSVSQTTDAQYAGHYYNAESPEILVGHVSYGEVSSLLGKIAYNEYAVGIVGSKIVITAGVDTGLPNAVAAFLDYIRANAKDGSLSLPSDLLITGKSSTKAFKQFEDLPSFPGGMIKAISDCADGFMQLTISGTTAEMFTEYRNLLSNAGFSLYSENDINNNLFAAYTKSEHTIYSYYTPYSGETRVIASHGAKLPSTASPEYTKITEPSVTMLGLEIGGESGGLGIIMQFEDGSFAIVDGGHNTDVEANEIYKKLLELAPDPARIVIRAWIITHAHGDHYGAFSKFTSMYSRNTRFTVESFIFNFCDTTEQTQYMSGTSSFDSVRKTIKNSYPLAKVYKAFTGQVYRFPGSDMEILTCMSDFLPNIIGLEMSDADKTKSDANIQSLVVRFFIGGQSVMVTGDVSKINVDQMCDRFGNYLASDMLTVPHHGWNQNRYRARNGTIEFYKFVNPAVVLWPDSVSAQANKMKWNGTPGSDWEANYYLIDRKSVV